MYQAYSTPRRIFPHRFLARDRSRTGPGGTAPHIGQVPKFLRPDLTMKRYSDVQTVFPYWYIQGVGVGPPQQFWSRAAPSTQISKINMLCYRFRRCAAYFCGWSDIMASVRVTDKLTNDSSVPFHYKSSQSDRLSWTPVTIRSCVCVNCM